MNTQVLYERNKHARDENIQFFENGHQYVINTDTTKYTSVTTWNSTHFPNFDADETIKKMTKGKNWKEGHKYWGLTPEQIKEKQEVRPAMILETTSIAEKINDSFVVLS